MKFSERKAQADREKERQRGREREGERMRERERDRERNLEGLCGELAKKDMVRKGKEDLKTQAPFSDWCPLPDELWCDSGKTPGTVVRRPSSGFHSGLKNGESSNDILGSSSRRSFYNNSRVSKLS